MLDHDPEICSTSGFADARGFAAIGAKNVKYGSGNDQLNPHGADESVAIDQIRDTPGAIAAGILDFANKR